MDLPARFAQLAVAEPQWQAGVWERERSNANRRLAVLASHVLPGVLESGLASSGGPPAGLAVYGLETQPLGWGSGGGQLAGAGMQPPVQMLRSGEAGLSPFADGQPSNFLVKPARRQPLQRAPSRLSGCVATVVV